MRMTATVTRAAVESAPVFGKPLSPAGSPGSPVPRRVGLPVVVGVVVVAGRVGVGVAVVARAVLAAGRVAVVVGAAWVVVVVGAGCVVVVVVGAGWVVVVVAAGWVVVVVVVVGACAGAGLRSTDTSFEKRLAVTRSVRPSPFTSPMASETLAEPPVGNGEPDAGVKAP